MLIGVIGNSFKGFRGYAVKGVFFCRGFVFSDIIYRDKLFCVFKYEVNLGKLAGV